MKRKKQGEQKRNAMKVLLLLIILIIFTLIIKPVSSSVPTIATNKQEYILGEKVVITINDAPLDAEVKIITGDNIYKFIGELNHTMDFLPSTTGDYIISLEYGYSESRAYFKVNPLPELTQGYGIQGYGIISRIYSPSELEYERKAGNYYENYGSYYESPFNAPIMPEQGSEIRISKEWFVIKGHDNLEVKKELEVYDPVKDKKYFSSEDSFATPLGVYDALIRLDNHPVKSVLFRNLQIPGNSALQLRIDDLTSNPEKAGENSNQFYAIDPVSLNFTEAYVTVTAKGNVLRKCKAWNYEARVCNGSWEYVMNIVPGENYTFILTPEDPAYNETTLNADNCYNENAGRLCTVDEITAISANGGTSYVFNKNSGSPVRISFANESANISEVIKCTVYVKGYDSERNTWTLQTGNWSTNTWYTGTGQSGPNPEGTINWNCTPHFTRQTGDEALFDDFAVRISSSDGGTPATAYIDYVYVVINFSIKDQTPPYYSNVVATPSSPATYNSSITYQFNTTWQDNEAIHTTWIEHNFTGTFTNQTMSRTGNTSYFTYTGLAAGNYAWRTHANDTSGNINNTMPWQTYTINKANSNITLLLNNTQSNFTVNNSGSVNITAILNSGEGNISVYENGVSIINGSGRITTIRSYTLIGDYNITASYLSTQNYTASSITYYVNVKDTIPPGTVTNLRATANGTSWILWNWTNPSDADFHHVEVWLNGEFKLNTTNQYYNASGLLANTQYEIQIRSVDNRSPANIGIFVNDTAWTKPSGDTTPPAIMNVQNKSITDSTATITWDTNEPATSIVKYGTSSGVYNYTFTNLTLTINHSVILSGLSSGKTYYYVVNSSDYNANSNQSTEYSFITLQDQSPPYYSNIIASPASPAIYNSSTTYQFNTTWQDNEAIHTTWIEHNFTGTFTNQTMSRTGNTSYFTYTGLAAGNYAWKTHANDTSGNINNTMPWQTYTINKANSQIILFINGTTGNLSINESQSINITGITIAGEGNLTLYQNGTILSQGPSPLISILIYETPGSYNLTLYYNETQNYTLSSTTSILTVNDTRAPWIILLAPEQNETDLDGDITFIFSVNDTSEVKNCSLYINDTYNQGKDIYTKGQNTFTLNGLSNGNYSWYVSCSDYANHSNTSEKRNFTVRINEYYPTLRPAACSDNNGCTLSNINNTPNIWEEHGTLQKGTTQANYVYINFSKPNIPAGSTIHWMYIYYDKYQSTLSGFLRLEWLNGSNWVSICNVNYGSSTYHAHDVVNCSFTSSNTPNITQINNGLQLRAEFYYSGTASGINYGTDEAFINLKYTEDTTPPTVELISPSTYHRPGQVNFTYRAEDANLMNCTLWGDFNGSWAPNISNTNPISGQNSNLTINLIEGFYTWNVKCCDVANNCAFDIIGGPNGDGNYTVNITDPDLIVSAIAFNSTYAEAKEGMSVTINATIRNRGNVDAIETFKVQFYLGDPDNGGIQIGSNKTIEGLTVNENKTINTTWIIDKGGPRNIYVIVDPPLASGGLVKETLEDNNKANQTFHVPAYNYFFGYAEHNIYLGNANNDSLYYYLGIMNVSGNIMVADSESIISFSNLQALGRDINNNTASDDFAEADIALNMTGYIDSIRKLYTNNTNTPLAVMTFNIFNKNITNVPVIQSTNQTNFVTGVLWDKSDGGSQYTGSQDLVFITRINKQKQGAYGEYDYEIRVPVNLKMLIEPAASVTFYTEITEAAVN